MSLSCANPTAASHLPSPEKAAPSKDKVIRLSATNMARPLSTQHAQRGPAPSSKPAAAAAAAAEMPYLCGYKGCTFRARTKFEMQGHRYSKDCKGQGKALTL